MIELDRALSGIETPPSLLPSEAALFRQIVNACDPRHFAQSDAPLIVCLAQAVLLGRAAARRKDFAQWQAATRLQITLATKLRLTPRARLDPKTVGRRKPTPGRRPWESAS